MKLGRPGEDRCAWLTLRYSCRLSAAFGQERTACLTDSASAPGTSSTLMCKMSSSSTSKTSGTSPAQTAFASQASRSTSTLTARLHRRECRVIYLTGGRGPISFVGVLGRLGRHETADCAYDVRPA